MQGWRNESIYLYPQTVPPRERKGNMNTWIWLTYFWFQHLFVLLFMYLFTWRLTYVGMSPTRQPHWGDSLAGIWYSDLQCAGAGFTLLAKPPEIQRDGLLCFVYEFRSLKLRGSFCLVLIFHQSASLKLCTFCFPDGAAEELDASETGW